MDYVEGDDYDREGSDMEISDGDGDREAIGGGYYSSDFDESEVKDIAGVCTLPIFSDDDPDRLDTSHACVVVVDGLKLKKKSSSLLNLVLCFSFQCIRKSNLPLFSHRGDPEWCEGGLASVEGVDARDDELFSDLAKKAVRRYNSLTKEKKLQFKEVMKGNFYVEFEYFLTFSATTIDTGESGLYQAALIWTCDRYLVGLLRELSTERVLMMMTVTGAEEELAAKKKVLEACGVNDGGFKIQ